MAPYLIDKTILLAVLAQLKEARQLQFSDAETLPAGRARKSPDEMAEDRHKAWFIFRRAELIGSRHASFTAANLKPLVDAQFTKVQNYLIGMIGPTGPLNGFFEPGGQSSASADEAFTVDSTHHLDLQNVAVWKVHGTSSANREARFRRQRLKAVRSIVWHAAGLHDELWSNGGDGDTPNIVALNEILDRRLRSIERMRYQVNGPGAAKTSPQGNGRGPWEDTSRVRVFEYPYFDMSLISSDDLIGEGHPTGIFWSFAGTNPLKQYVGPGGLQTRFDGEPNTLSANWLQFPPPPPPDPRDTYARLPGAGSIATALDALFQPRINVWERAWLYCDHSIAAMHLEALRFAMQRRGQGAAFDGLVRPKFPYLAGIIGGDITYDSNGKPSVADSNTVIWIDGVSTGPTDTGVFDNLFVDNRDLQVGDHVILWNHHLYVFVTTGAWRLENAFVTDIDPVLTNWDEKAHPIDPAVFMKPDFKSLELAGFGATHKYPTFMEDLWFKFRNAFRAMQAQTQTTVSQAAGFFVFERSAARALVLRWAPYPTGLNGSPWWVFLQRVVLADKSSPWPTKQKMREVIKNSVINDSGRGSDYVPPPTSIQVPHEAGRLGPRNLTDGVFFPLFVPVVDGVEMSWDEFFLLRSIGFVEANLVRLATNTEMIPGLFVRGTEQPIETIRPRVRP